MKNVAVGIVIGFVVGWCVVLVAQEKLPAPSGQVKDVSITDEATIPWINKTYALLDDEELEKIRVIVAKECKP